jgi:hypothetical protein
MANEFLKKILAPLTKYAPHDHNHDDRYYTESEVNDLLKEQSGSVDLVSMIAPDYSNAIELPTHVFTTDTWWSPYVYKINVPGYFYFSVRRTACDIDIGPVLGSSFVDLDLLPTQRGTYASKVLIWHSVTRQDDYTDNGFEWPLLVPGTSTYMRFWCGSVTDGGTNQADPKMCFLPCRFIKNKVSRANCITWQSTTNGIDNDKRGNDWLLGNHPSAVGSAIFAGDWKSLHSVKWYYHLTDIVEHFLNYFKGQEVCYA